jgi:hypothetical protein
MMTLDRRQDDTETTSGNFRSMDEAGCLKSLSVSASSKMNNTENTVRRSRNQRKDQQPFLSRRTRRRGGTTNNLSHGDTEDHGDTEEQPTTFLAENAETQRNIQRKKTGNS